MRLTVLGGSAASPNTGAGCSGYLLESGRTQLLIDPGPGTLLELRKHADFRTISAILVSHMHLDHMLDLLAIRHALAYNPVRLPGPIPVWLPPGGAAFLARAAAPFDEHDDPGRFASTVQVREFEPETMLRVGEIEITFARTVHYIPTWAMRFSTLGSGDLGYTADTGPAANLGGFFAGVTTLLAEATLREPSPDPARGSMTAQEAGSLALRAGARRLVLTHIWEEYGAAGAIAAAGTRFPGPIDVAVPGLRIEV